MKLLYISTFMFNEKDGAIFGLPSCSEAFFAKYLDVFDSIKVLGENIKPYLDSSKLIKINVGRISVRILPRNTSPKEFINDRVLKKALQEEIEQANAILIKPSTRRGLMAIRIAERLQKPYMIEVTGDIHNALLQSPSRIRRMYASFLYYNIKNTIKNCQFGLYVSEFYLQSKYKIAGKTCGCSDVILEKSDESVLKRRLAKIDEMKAGDVINLALIGFYHGNGKGVDTAIRAISRLPENHHLTILGNGNEESRNMWIAYGRLHGVEASRIHFPAPLNSSSEVQLWIDDYDFFVLPTRSEGFGRAIAEAMSRGCPCLATAIATIPELLPKKCLFPLDDDFKIAELISLYINNKGLMKKLAKDNFENAKRFDFDLLKTRRNDFLQEFKMYCETKYNEE